MSEVPQVLLGHHLKALKLPTFLREHDKLARRCAAEGVDHTGYLLRLCELELLDRLTHHVHILELNGESYRLKASRRRQHGKPEAALDATSA